MADTSDSQTSFLLGSLDHIATVSAYLDGATPVTSDLSAYLFGDVGNTSSLSAFLLGSGGEVTSFAKAYLDGITSNSQHAYLKGAMFTVNGTEIVIIGGVLYG